MFARDYDPSEDRTLVKQISKTIIRPRKDRDCSACTKPIRAGSFAYRVAFLVGGVVLVDYYHQGYDSMMGCEAD